MMLSELWPYVLALLALMGGAAFGWWLGAARRGQRASAAILAERPTAQNSPARAKAEIGNAQEVITAVRVAEAEMPQLEARLSYLNKAVALARQQLGEADQEYDRLLLALDERRASISEAQGDIATVHERMQTRNVETDQLLRDIDRNIEELDMLVKMQEGYNAKINRLTQQVQWQDGELRMLRETVRARSTEIEEARGLLEQRDSELRLLTRQRAQREIDIEHARQIIGRKDDELRSTVGNSAADPFVTSSPETQQPASPPTLLHRGERGVQKEEFPVERGSPKRIALRGQEETRGTQAPARRVPPPPPPRAAPPSAARSRQQATEDSGGPVSPGSGTSAAGAGMRSRAILPAPEAPAAQVEPGNTDDLESEMEDDEEELFFPPDNDIAAIPRLAEYYAAQLRSQGVGTVEQLAERTPEEVYHMLTIPAHHSPDIEAWIRAARRIVQRHASRSQKQ